MEKEWVIVYETNDPYRANIIKAALEDAGINCVILDTKGNTFTSIGDAKIYVHESDLEEAELIISDIHEFPENDELSEE